MKIAREESIGRPLKTWSIFVSGFSKHTTAGQVWEYFSGFCKLHVEKYESFFKSNPTNQQFPGGDGYFVLHGLNLTAYNHILQVPHLFAGRSLETSPLKSGTELIVHNYQRNLRKVLLKKVPLFLSQESLLAQLTQAFGPVERIFSYKSDKIVTAALCAAHQKTSTYSVTFRHKVAATKAADQNTMEVTTERGQFVCFIDKFCRSKLDQPNLMEDHSYSPSATKASGEEIRPNKRTYLPGNASKPIRISSGYKKQPALGVSQSPCLHWPTDTDQSAIQASRNTRKKRRILLRSEQGLHHANKPTSKWYQMRFLDRTRDDNLVLRRPLKSAATTTYIVGLATPTQICDFS